MDWIMDLKQIFHYIKKEKKMPKTESSNVEKLEKDLAAGTLVDSAESLEWLIQKVNKAQRIFAT